MILNDINIKLWKTFNNDKANRTKSEKGKLLQVTLIENAIFLCRQMYVDTCKGKINKKTQKVRKFIGIYLQQTPFSVKLPRPSELVVVKRFVKNNTSLQNFSGWVLLQS